MRVAATLCKHFVIVMMMIFLVLAVTVISGRTFDLPVQVQQLAYLFLPLVVPHAYATARIDEDAFPPEKIRLRPGTIIAVDHQLEYYQSATPPTWVFFLYLPAACVQTYQPECYRALIVQTKGNASWITIDQRRYDAMRHRIGCTLQEI